MVTIKSHTDLSQSKTLSKILPHESADMEYLTIKETGTLVGVVPFIKDDSEVDNSAYSHTYDRIACWSLAALLGILPKGTNISTPKPINALNYCCWNQYNEIYADNPIDACYEMILKLHELKML